MANKVDDKVLKRIAELKAIGLTDKVVSIRLGIAERTVRVYTRHLRTGAAPYKAPTVEP